MTKAKRAEESAEVELGLGDRWFVSCLGLMVIGVFALLPFALAFMVVSGDLRGYGDAIHGIALIGQQVQSNYYPAVAVLVTVLLTLAAATGLGRHARRLPARTYQVVLMAVSVGAMLIAMMAAWVLPVAVVFPSQWASVVIIVIVAWIALLSTQVVLGVTSPTQRAEQARKAWRERKSRAAGYGIRRTDAVDIGTLRWARFALWLLPLLLWLLIVVAVVVSGGLGGKAWLQVVYAGSLCGFGLLIATVGWWGTADRSGPPRALAVLRSVVVFVAVAISLIFAGTLIGTGQYAALGVALGIVALLHAAVLLISTRRQGLPGLRSLERGITVKALNRAKSISQEARAIARPAARA